MPSVPVAVTWPLVGADGSLTRLFSRFAFRIVKPGKNCLFKVKGHLTITIEVTDDDSAVGDADFGAVAQFFSKILLRKFWSDFSTNHSLRLGISERVLFWF